MSRFIETIRIFNGRRYNLSRHSARMNRTRLAIFGCRDVLNLHHVLIVPENARQGLVKCRIIYGKEILRIEFDPYIVRPVNSLKVMDAGDLDYPYKSTDRHAIDALYAQREMCDDILMTRDGFVTDTSYANIALRRGNRWYTPATPLLAGTMRAQLIDQGRLLPAVIRTEDLPAYSECLLINAMLGFDPRRAFSMDAIR